IPDACHCTICRKSSGHFYVGAEVLQKDVTITGDDHVTWYDSSERVRRGFCKTCGSQLFFDPVRKTVEWIGIAMGAFETPTDAQTDIPLFVANKGAYYELTDGPPQHDPIPPRP